MLQENTPKLTIHTIKKMNPSEVLNINKKKIQLYLKTSIENYGDLNQNRKLCSTGSDLFGSLF